MIRFENIKHIATLKKDFVKMDGVNTVKSLIKSLRTRINEISDFIPYPSITEGSVLLDEKYFARGVAFQISQDANNKAIHMLEVSVLHPHKQIEYTRPLACGDKNAISDYLNNDKIYDSALQQVKEMCAEFKAE